MTATLTKLADLTDRGLLGHRGDKRQVMRLQEAYPFLRMSPHVCHKGLLEMTVALKRAAKPKPTSFTSARPLLADLGPRAQHSRPPSPKNRRLSRRTASDPEQTLPKELYVVDVRQTRTSSRPIGRTGRGTQFRLKNASILQTSEDHRRSK